jgi:TatA/E family protein of Tat protein translocase
MIPGFNGIDLIILFIVALLVFGPKRLPEIGSAIGRGIQEFRKGSHETTSPEDEKNGTQQTAVREPRSASEKSRAHDTASSTETRAADNEKE